MIIVIQGQSGTGKSTLAQALAKSVFPQYPEVIESIPKKKPYLGSLTIFTHLPEDDLPKWLLGRKDYTMIYLSSLKEKLPKDWSEFKMV
jgi:DNA replication protein DnaC